jgi:hypothetical protein
MKLLQFHAMANWSWAGRHRQSENGVQPFEGLRHDVHGKTIHEARIETALTFAASVPKAIRQYD